HPWTRRSDARVPVDPDPRGPDTPGSGHARRRAGSRAARRTGASPLGRPCLRCDQPRRGTRSRADAGLATERAMPIAALAPLARAMQSHPLGVTQGEVAMGRICAWCGTVMLGWSTSKLQNQTICAGCVDELELTLATAGLRLATSAEIPTDR